MRLPLMLSLTLALVAATARGERLPPNPAEMRQEATHIVTGRVNAIYSRIIRHDKGREETHYLVEIAIDAVEKGASLQENEFVYARCWRIKNYGNGGPQPGPSGHWLAKEGDVVRAHLVRGKYRVTGQTDDGFTVVYPNGLIVVEE